MPKTDTPEHQDGSYFLFLWFFPKKIKEGQGWGDEVDEKSRRAPGERVMCLRRVGSEAIAKQLDAELNAHYAEIPGVEISHYATANYTPLECNDYDAEIEAWEDDLARRPGHLARIFDLTQRRARKLEDQDPNQSKDAPPERNTKGQPGEASPKDRRPPGKDQGNHDADQPTKVLTDTQRNILNLLNGKALTLQQLARELTMSQDAVFRAMRPLRPGRIHNQRGLGYFRVDAPPPTP